MVAWLVTWESATAKVQKAPRERIAAILSPRTDAKLVLGFVEMIHNRACYTLLEQASFANRRAFDPYPAEFGQMGNAPFAGRITCGHNPYLYARVVDKLRIRGAAGHEEVTWTERALPKRAIAPG